MKNMTKMILLSVTMFVAGIASAVIIGRYFVLPDLAKDIAKFGYEASDFAYRAGYIDATNGNNYMYDTYFVNEEMKEINDWEYKYITEH